MMQINLIQLQRFQAFTQEYNDEWYDDRVQPRLNPVNLDEPSELVTQASWVLEPSLSPIALFIKTN